MRQCDIFAHGLINLLCRSGERIQATTNVLGHFWGTLGRVADVARPPRPCCKGVVSPEGTARAAKRSLEGCALATSWGLSPMRPNLLFLLFFVAKTENRWGQAL